MLPVMKVPKTACDNISLTHSLTHCLPLMALLPLVMVAYVCALFLPAACHILRTAVGATARGQRAPVYQIEGTVWCLPATSVKSRPAQLSVSIPAVLSPIRLGRTSAMGSPLASQRATPNGAEVARG